MRDFALWTRYRLLWILSIVSSQASRLLYSLAADAYLQGNASASLRSLDRAVQVSRSGRGVDLACDLGDLQFDLQDFEAAAASYQRALDEDHRYPRALRGKGLSLHEMGEGSEAVYYYVSLLQRDPDDIDVILNLALILIWDGRFDDASERLAVAEELAPDSVDVQEVRAELAYARGDIDEGISILERLVADFPDRCEPKRVLGIYLQSVGRMLEADIQFQSALECEPDNPKLHLALTSYYQDLEDGASIVQHGLRAIEILTLQRGRPDELANAYWHLGWGYFLLDDLAASITANQTAVELVPSLWGARADLALAQLCAGELERASENYHLVAQMATDASDLRIVAIEDLKEAIRAERVTDQTLADNMLSLLRARERSLQAVVGGLR